MLVENFPELIRIIILYVNDPKSFGSTLLVSKKIYGTLTKEDLVAKELGFRTKITTEYESYFLDAKSRKVGERNSYNKFTKLLCKEFYVAGLLEGKHEIWWNDIKLSQEHYLHGLLHGERTTWHTNGVVCSTETYVNGKTEGKYIVYNRDGSLWKIYDYVDGKIVSEIYDPV